MNNAFPMSAQFEKEKNVQASIYTGVITGALILLFILVKWPVIIQAPEPIAEFIDVNLGNGEVGSGNDQPMLPGEPAPAQAQEYTPPAPQQTTAAEDVRDISNDNETSPDAAAVTKPRVSNPTATKVNQESKVAKTNTTTPTPPAPPAPRPKAVAGRTLGGNGSGGNGATEYKPGSGEGPGNGAGDAGVVGGNPNGRNYSGQPRVIGGARIYSIPSATYRDDFKESGKIYLDISVNASGKLTAASYHLSGSTLPKSSRQYSIAVDRARQMEWPKYPEGAKMVVGFNFQVGQ